MEKEIYSISELVKLGYPERFLKEIVLSKRQRFAWKMPGGKKWYINRIKLDQFLEAEQRRK